MDGEAIRLYCGVSETGWNTLPAAPGEYTCASPVYGRSKRRETRVRLPPDTKVLLDSGAFTDGPGLRLGFQAALRRQVEHAKKWKYAKQVEWIVAYDQLIDEKWIDGKRYKSRWLPHEAESAVNTTIDACRYYVLQRLAIASLFGHSVSLVLPVQGVNARQQFECAKTIMPLLASNDILGLGGWCILGMQQRWMPEFWRTMWWIVPEAGRLGVQRVHIFGVMLASALGGLLWLSDQYGIQLSTDSAGPSKRPAFGDWGYADWRTKCNFLAGEERGMARARHVQEVRKWLAQFRDTQYYKEPPRPGMQLRLFGECLRRQA